MTSYLKVPVTCNISTTKGPFIGQMFDHYENSDITVHKLDLNVFFTYV